MVASYALAMAYTGSLVTLLLTTYGAVVQFMPALVATLYWPRATGAGVLSGMWVGAVVTGGMVVMPSILPVPVHAGVVGLVANVAVMVAMSWARPAQTSNDWLAVASGAIPAERPR